MENKNLDQAITDAFKDTTEPGEVLLDYVVCGRFETPEGAEYTQYVSNKSVSSSSVIGLLETVKHMALSNVVNVPNSSDVQDLTRLLDDNEEEE